MAGAFGMFSRGSAPGAMKDAALKYNGANSGAGKTTGQPVTIRHYPVLRFSSPCIEETAERRL